MNGSVGVFAAAKMSKALHRKITRAEDVVYRRLNEFIQCEYASAV